MTALVLFLTSIINCIAAYYRFKRSLIEKKTNKKISAMLTLFQYDKRV